jgi:hypothetical protein
VVLADESRSVRGGNSAVNPASVLGSQSSESVSYFGEASAFALIGRSIHRATVEDLDPRCQLRAAPMLWVGLQSAPDVHVVPGCVLAARKHRQADAVERRAYRRAFRTPGRGRACGVIVDSRQFDSEADRGQLAVAYSKLRATLPSDAMAANEVAQLQVAFGVVGGHR